MHPLYYYYPREVSRKRKVVYSWEEFVGYIKRNNGYSQMLSTSLYGFREFTEDGTPIYNSAVVDKLLYDFDSGEGYDPLIEARKLDSKLVGYERCRIMSGGGIHIIPLIEPVELQWPSVAIKGLREYLASGVLKDDAVGGNVAQHVRIINTFNSKRLRYCIPLTDDQFMNMTWTELQTLAKKPQSLVPDMIIGRRKIDYISMFDIEPPPEVHIDTNLSDYPVLESDLDKKCMKIKSDAGNIDRYILISSLVEKAFSKQAIIDYLEKILSPSKFQHCVYVENQVDKIFDGNMVCFSCQRIKDMKKCKNNCKYEE